MLIGRIHGSRLRDLSVLCFLLQHISDQHISSAMSLPYQHSYGTLPRIRSRSTSGRGRRGGGSSSQLLLLPHPEGNEGAGDGGDGGGGDDEASTPRMGRPASLPPLPQPPPAAAAGDSPGFSLSKAKIANDKGTKKDKNGKAGGIAGGLIESPLAVAAAAAAVARRPRFGSGGGGEGGGGSQGPSAGSSPPSGGASSVLHPGVPPPQSVNGQRALTRCGGAMVANRNAATGGAAQQRDGTN